MLDVKFKLILWTPFLINSLKLNLYLAFRFLFHRQHSALFYFLTFLSVTLMALSLLAFLTVQAVLTGFETDLKEKIVGLHPHVRIPLKEGVPYEGVEEKISSQKGLLGMQRAILGEALLKIPRQEISQGVKLIALSKDPRGFTRALRFSTLRDFDWSELAAGPERLPSLILGEELVKEMVLMETLDEELDLIFPFGTLGPTGRLEPVKKTFQWKSNFKSGYFEADSRWVLMELKAAQALLGEFARKELWLFLKNPDEALEVAQGWRTLGAKAWQEEQKSLFAALKLERLGARLLLSLLLGLGVLTLLNVNFLLVLERRLEINLLKALGFRASKIRGLFNQMALFLGALSGLAGLFGAWGLCTWLKSQGFPLPEAYYVESLPILWRWDYGILAFLLLLVLCFLSSALPARRSTKVGLEGEVL